MKFIKNKTLRYTVVSIISFLFILFITGLLLGLIINIIYGGFSFRLIRIAFINSFFLSLGIILNLTAAKYLTLKIKPVLLILISFSLTMGISIFGFIFVFLFDPIFFIYENNVVYLYLIINFLFIISFSLISTGFLIYQTTLIENERKINNERILRQETEQKLYASKINPHFLFNSLNLIVSLLKKPKLAEKVLINLSELLRDNIDLSNKDIIPLEKELKTVEKYLYIQKLRFQEKLEYSINCKINGLVPPLILQPLVENSIKHNINNHNYLKIKIDILKDKKNLIIKIFDSPSLLKEDMIGTGTGLSNTKKRIEISGGSFIIKNGGIEIKLKL